MVVAHFQCNVCKKTQSVFFEAGTPPDAPVCCNKPMARLFSLPKTDSIPDDILIVSQGILKEIPDKRIYGK